ncbi:potassium voltage-gated channel subfamily H member 8-like [Schistocerca piceifrons]|uniref:potassium voltage-gated channel subfamily H member 8-like n=1 Tax=Schistocerca piceifrons TaxID=274613 RepID=UPI001F5EE3AE|nr:potassium voltage-gated channel subfamily H member 8-like [Schistocerca piceifrons]
MIHSHEEKDDDALINYCISFILKTTCAHLRNNSTDFSPESLETLLLVHPIKPVIARSSSYTTPDRISALNCLMWMLHLGIIFPQKIKVETRTWFTDVEKIDFYPDSPFQRYLICTYYISSTMMGIGLGDIVSANNVERYLTIITMASGQVIIVGLFVGSWSTVLEGRNRPYFEFRYRVGLMTHEMRSRAVPERLKNRVLAFYESFWKRCHAVVNSALFQRLPLAMIREVNLDIYWKATNSLSLLQDLHISEKREISSVMTTQHFMPGDFISREGDLTHSMLYIAEGVVQVYVKGIDYPAASLSAGSCIGGGVGLFLGGRRSTSLRALTCCSLHVLSRSDFFRVASKFPIIAQKMRRKFEIVFVYKDKIIIKRSIVLSYMQSAERI